MEKGRQLKRIPSKEHLLTPEEYRIIRTQIRKNSVVIDEYIAKIDLMVNKEGYPRSAPEVERLRKTLNILIEENDTFRKVFWKHTNLADKWIDFQNSLPDPITFLVEKIKERRKLGLNYSLAPTVTP